MNQYSTSTMRNFRQRDWRIPDQSSPLQNLIRKSSLSNSSQNNASQSNQTSSSSNTNNPTNVIKLKSVTEPTTVWKFITILIIHICKKILYIRLNVKIIVYICSIVMISMATDHFPLPRCFLSDTNSCLNLYFIKYAWTITCALNGLFIYYTSSIFYCGQLRDTNRSLVRLAVGAAWWFACSIIFDLISNKYGVCIGGNQNAFNRDSCTGRWLAFSVSDRMFILFHSMLVTMEEAKALPVLERLNEIIIKNEPDLLVSSKLPETKIKTSKELYLQNISTIRWIIVMLTILVLTLDFTLVTTIIYFNNMPQKLSAALFALLGWLLTYKSWFKRKPAIISNLWSPKSPRDNLFIAVR